jgi:uncharacterized delta-60 repeat protein
LIPVVAAACGGGNGGGGRAGFGTAGKVRTDFGGDDSANALAIQPDGKIIAAGRTGPAFALARYTRDGRLDRRFGSGGRVVTDFGAPAGKDALLLQHGAAAVAIEGDGKIVAAGGRGSDFALARYLPDGRLDPTFGEGGKVVTDIPAHPRRFAEFLERGANAVAIQPDGKIIAAGAGAQSFALARYTWDGRLDRSFGSGGEVFTDFGGHPPQVEDYAEALAVQADGKIIAAGGRSGELFELARYLPNGHLDPGFGRGGRVVTNRGDSGYDVVQALALQPDGKVIAAGGRGPRFPAVTLARYTATGQLDRSFGGGGPANGRANGANAVALERDGRIVVAGVDNQMDLETGGPTVYHLALIRYRRDGRLDPTFGKRSEPWAVGSVQTRVELGRATDLDNLLVTAVAIQGAGKIVVAGGSGRSLRSRDFLLVRYRPDGSIDS